MTITYDRTADEDLLKALERGGWASSLVAFARAPGYPLDLQLRGYATKSNETWATLYVGLTKVLDLRFLPKRGFRLRAHATHATRKNGWNSVWDARWHSADQLQDQWRDVELYLERAIPSIHKHFLVEGAVQSAVSGFQSESMLVIDREAAVTFSNDAEKRRITGRLARPLLDAVKQPGRGSWWTSRPSSLGGECDVLAIDLTDGSLMAIEVKPRSATTTIRWSPLQVHHYANLFREWIYGDDGIGEVKAAEVLRNVVAQRKRLGLIGDQEYPAHSASPIRVRPVIAIGRGYSDAAYSGLTEVGQRLIDAGLDDPPLEVRTATLWGELKVIDA
jgi:hypothetical protein